LVLRTKLRPERETECEQSRSGPFTNSHSHPPSGAPCRTVRATKTAANGFRAPGRSGQNSGKGHREQLELPGRRMTCAFSLRSFDARRNKTRPRKVRVIMRQAN